MMGLSLGKTTHPGGFDNDSSHLWSTKEVTFMKKFMLSLMLTLSTICLTTTGSWAYAVYSYQCQIVKITYDTYGTMVHVVPGVKETGFSDEARVFIDNYNEASKTMLDMVLSAGSGDKEIIIGTEGKISWAPQLVQNISVVVSDEESAQERTTYHGPLTLKSYAVDNNGSYYYVEDPSNLPENAVAVRVPTHKPTLASFMTNAYMNGKKVLVVISHRWWLGPNELAWTIYAAKLQ